MTIKFDMQPIQQAEGERTVIPHLARGPTSLRRTDGLLWEFHGLFTLKSLKKGDFVGIWSGKALSQNRFNKSDIAMEVGPYQIEPRTWEQDPLVLANEPPAGSIANMCTHAITKNGCKIAELREAIDPTFTCRSSIDGVVFRAAADIPEGSELFYHYGSEYHNHRIAKYELDATGAPLVGHAAACVAVKEIPREQGAIQYFLEKGWCLPKSACKW